MIEQSPHIKHVIHMELIHGKDAVWNAGIAALGYPGDWITEKDESRAVQAHFLNM